jgi:hypothetical protein
MQQIQGNRAVQRLIQREDEFRLSDPELTLPASEKPDFNMGSLQLNPEFFQQLPIENTLSPELLLRPSPELLQQLVDNWMLQYRLLRPAPTPYQNAWQQLWTAWRQKTDEWIARGADAVLMPEQAQDLLRDRAAEDVIQHILSQHPAEESDSELDVGAIAGKVWPAFEQALNTTEFYPRLQAQAEEQVLSHWPALLMALGGSLGTAIGTGLSDNDWRGMEMMTGHLLPLVNTEIELSDRLTLTLGFEESSAIEGMTEQGVVIGMQPTIGLRWDLQDRQIRLEGSGNVRLETGQDSTRGVQVHALPTIQLRW